MAKNFPGPLEVELLYSVAPSGGINILHKQRLNCIYSVEPSPGDPVGNIQVVRRGGTLAILTTAVNEYLALVYPFNAQTFTTYIGYNVWKYTPGTFVRTFITGVTLGTNGLSANPPQPAHQDILTFKTQEGNEMRLVFLETVLTFQGIDNAPLADANMDALFDYVIGTNNWIVARDTSYPIVQFNWLGGQNEKTFKQRYR